MTEKVVAPKPTVDEASAALVEFFKLNPYSSVIANDDGDLEIVKPWNDSSLILDVEGGLTELAEALNNVRLPERLSAIWHADEKRLEIIWTAFKLHEVHEEIADRKFSFVHNGFNYDCEFGKSSDRLMTIAKYAVPAGISETKYRNIQSFRVVALGETEDDFFGEPRSVWIGPIEWDEDRVISMISHLNFYLRYFDALTPTIIVHPAISERVIAKRTRYIKGKFPTIIEGASLDENLLSFWSFADSGEPMLRFLLYYRILEYATFHFVNDEIRDNLKKIILAPDLRSDIGHSIGQIVGAVVAPSKLQDSQRLRAMMKKSVRPELMWRDLSANSDFFGKDTKFDGGFTVRAPIGKNDTAETFDDKGVERLADRFRDIRNALSHGKDQETAGVIRSTSENADKFRPWVHLIATAAGEVVLYGSNP